MITEDAAALGGDPSKWYKRCSSPSDRTQTHCRPHRRRTRPRRRTSSRPAAKWRRPFSGGTRCIRSAGPLSVQVVPEVGDVAKESRVTRLIPTEARLRTLCPCADSSESIGSLAIPRSSRESVNSCTALALALATGPPPVWKPRAAGGPSPKETLETAFFRGMPEALLFIPRTRHLQASIVVSQ